MNKLFIVVLISALALQGINAASCTITAASGAGGVKTQTATAADGCPDTCYRGYALTGATTSLACAICTTDALPTTVDSSATACTACVAGNYCDRTAISATADGTVQITCPVGFYCPAAAVTPTACSTDSAAPKTTAATGKSLTADCSAIASTVTVIPGCAVYTGANCAYTVAGYQSVAYAGVAASAVVKCINGCDRCSGALTGSCTTAAAGYFIDTTTASAITVQACDDGCATCNYDSTTTSKSKCATAKAGWAISSAFALTKCANGTGNTAATHSEATCTACAAASNCGNCTLTTKCTTCAPGYLLDATAGTCTAFDQTKKAATCLKAQGSGVDSCQSCDTAQFRALPVDSSSVTVTVGACGCKPGYGDKSGLATPDPVCVACGDPVANYASCTIGSTGAISATTCATGLISAGLMCAAQAASAAPTGFMFDTATGTFKGCAPLCATCTGTTPSTCLTCKAREATFAEPSSSNSAYAMSLGTRVFSNGTCLDACPTGFSPNSARDSCVAGAAAAGATGGSASGVFAVFALIASLFIIF